jgi:hypothetical protein
LNLIGFSAVSCSRSLAMNLAFCNSVCSAVAKASSTRNRVSLVCRPTIPKGSLLYKRQGS